MNKGTKHYYPYQDVAFWLYLAWWRDELTQHVSPTRWTNLRREFVGRYAPD